MDFIQTQPVIQTYLDRVSKHITLDAALLFGSLAEGTVTEESDIDLLIISDDFALMDEDDRLRLLYRLTVGIPLDLHLYGVTNHEHQSASPLTTLGTIHKQKTIRLH